jgi:hypothetical protein
MCTLKADSIRLEGGTGRAGQQCATCVRSHWVCGRAAQRLGPLTAVRWPRSRLTHSERQIPRLHLVLAHQPEEAHSGRAADSILRLCGKKNRATQAWPNLRKPGAVPVQPYTRRSTSPSTASWSQPAGSRAAAVGQDVSGLACTVSVHSKAKGARGGAPAPRPLELPEEAAKMRPRLRGCPVASNRFLQRAKGHENKSPLLTQLGAD